MIQIGNKEIKLVKLLSNHQYEMSIETLGNQYNFSERAVKYAIGFINSFLKEKQVSWRFLTANKQITLEGEGSRDAVLPLFQNVKKQEYYLSKEERSETIYFHYAANLGMNLEELAEYLGVSKTTVKQSLPFVRNMLKGYYLELRSVSKTRLSVFGEELKIRRAILEMLYNESRLSDLSQTSKTIEINTHNPYLKELMTFAIKKYNCQERASLLLNKAEGDFPEIENDEIYKLAFLNIIVILLRIEQGCYVAHENVTKLNNEGMLLSEKISQYYKEISGYQVSCLEFEEFVICLNKGYQEQINQQQQNKFFGSIILIQRAIGNFIAKACSKSNTVVNLDNEEIKNAIDMLYSHLYGAVERLQNNIFIINPFLEEIKQHHRQLFAVIKKDLECFTQEFGEIFSDHEISYLTIIVENLNLAIKRNSKRVNNVVLVCGMGYGTSNILKEKLERNFEVNVKQIVPYYKFYRDMVEDVNQKGGDVDLYISTVSIDTKGLSNVIEVSPLLIPSDIEKLKEAGLCEVSTDISQIMKIVEENGVIINKERMEEQLSTLFKQDFKKKNRYQNLLQVIKEEGILFHQQADTWEEGVRLAGMLLQKSGYVAESYVEDMVQNIKNLGAYITIGNGVALPHAMNNQNVYCTGFSLLTLSKPITFDNGKEVDVILGFCNCTGSEYAEHLVAFMDLIEHHRLLEIKNDMKHAKDFFDYMNKVISGARSTEQSSNII